MTTEKKLPDPPISQEVDLRGFGYMRFYGDVLFASQTWIEGSYEGRCACVRLWWCSFAKEIPSGSMPDSEKVFADYAGYGENLRKFRKIRSEIMRGWVKCSDGRFYHKFLIDKVVLPSWDKRIENKNRTLAASVARKSYLNGNRDVSRDDQRDLLRDVSRDDDVTCPYREGEGEIEGEERKKEILSSPSGDGPTPSPEGGLVPQDWKTTETEAVDLWNETAARIGAPKCVKLTPTRKSRLRARLRDYGGIPGWKRAMEFVEGSPFLRGEKTDWRADFDFVIQEKSFTKLMEGGYPSRGKLNGASARDTAWVGSAIQKLIAAGVTRKEIGALGLDGLSVRKDRDQWLQGKIKESSSREKGGEAR